MSISVSFYDAPVAARKLSNSKGKKRERFLIQGFDSKDNDLYSIAFKGKPLLEKPKSCFKDHRFIYLKVKAKNSDQIFFVKANRQSLMKRLGMNKQDLKKFPSSDYTACIQKKITELQAPLKKPVEEKPVEAVPKPVENPPTPEVVIKTMKVEWRKEGKKGTIEYTSLQDTLSQKTLDVILEDRTKIQVPINELSFFHEEGEGYTVYYSENGLIFSASLELSFDKINSTDLLHVIDEEDHSVISLFKRQLTLDEHSFKRVRVDIPHLKKKGWIHFLTQNDFVSALQAKNKEDIKISVEIDGKMEKIGYSKLRFPVNGYEAFTDYRGFGVVPMFIDHAPEEFDKIKDDTELVFINENGLLVLLEKEEVSFNKNDFFRQIDMEIPSSQLKGVINYYSFADLSKRKEFLIFLEDGSRKNYPVSEMKFNHSNIETSEVIYYDSEKNVNYKALSDYPIEDLKKMKGNEKITLLIDCKPFETERKNIKFVEEQAVVEAKPVLKPIQDIDLPKTMKVKTSNNEDGIVEYKNFLDLCGDKIKTKFIINGDEVFRDEKVSELRFFPEQGIKVFYAERGFIYEGIIELSPQENPFQNIPMIDADGFFTNIPQREIVPQKEKFKTVRVTDKQLRYLGEIVYTSFASISRGKEKNNKAKVRDPISQKEKVFKLSDLQFEFKGHDVFLFHRGLGISSALIEYTAQELSLLPRDLMITIFYNKQPYKVKVSQLSFKKADFLNSMEVNIEGENPLKGVISYYTLSELTKKDKVHVFHDNNKYQIRDFSEINFLPREDQNMTRVYLRENNEQPIYTDFDKEYIKNHPDQEIRVIKNSKIVVVHCRDLIIKK